MNILKTRKAWIIGIGLWLVQPVATRRIDGNQICRACSLRIDKVVRLSDPASGINGHAGNLTSVEKKVGRAGSGPGEFRYVLSLMVGPGDTVHVIDEGLRRRSEISPTTMEIVSQHPMPEAYWSFTMVGGGNFVGESPVPDRKGHPFEEVDRKGDRLRSFGGDGKTAPAWMRPYAGQRVVPDRHGGFYSHPRHDYVFEHRDAKGLLLGRWERDAPWFPRRALTRGCCDPSKGSPPDIFAAWVGDDGLLYVASHVRQDGWQKAIEERQMEGGRGWAITDYDRYFDSLVEVMDMKNSRLVAAVRHDLHFDGMAGNGNLYYKTDDPDDLLDVYRVTFVRR